jgi:hypothetical protein
MRKHAPGPPLCFLNFERRRAGVPFRKPAPPFLRSYGLIRGYAIGAKQRARKSAGTIAKVSAFCVAC